MAQVGESPCTVFTWGRGKEGQLGNGVYMDSAFPQPVGELQGRQVLQVNNLHWQFAILQEAFPSLKHHLPIYATKASRDYWAMPNSEVIYASRQPQLHCMIIADDF